ncbi:MAG: site-2 protease family protein [Clostridia bacterium]|nr:site-2 protease family protein [Clostridia bacterium]
MVTVIVSILVFGFLIFIHEFGHYITARIFKVTIEEFSIGMGPRLFSWKSKKTNIKYSLALFPIGGFVAMPGENGEYNEGAKESSEPDPYRDDPNTFGKKPAWQRLIITAAGATINIVFGFLAMIILTCLINIGNTRVAEYHTAEDLGTEPISMKTGLRIGDEIVEVGGKRVRILDELSYEIMRHGNEPVDLVVIRDGEEITLENVVFPTQTDQGQSFGLMDFKVNRVKKTFGSVMKYSWSKSTLIVRMVWESLYDLITGRYSFAAVSGPVGISSAIGSAAKAGFTSLLYITVLISINLGVMNLLPIPALDGGRLLTIIIELITRKKLPAKVEGIINGVGLMLLLGLSMVIMVKDIIQLL